ncbi:MAG: hypothetical protein CO186_11850 [Zetaproteobacteria bacterium CG_4_9_14_3_um_filter_49_83]|nr:MAG: hypothetical protein AUJ56_10265 [Zetaproteobacteria bacterium CG1_02_49_23]PIQ34412.1 MAG: hypothetical protein COW62_01720 [Zetaproteobacteria bacterium CG17_big_fil_post_rev_8_21_14_2_50_50_13]PIY56396.1 MAG: hypothetical protein COZ00_04210 [Zetaproteobacteria bacterium CG_4_10_14_0_8_um_filter_49_80]PJA34036.1 MAG: hypothetical protein CO186_11850 [Zetaproteobacteria bacterium CG_4_9_14_3_um_filter_49_83]
MEGLFTGVTKVPIEGIPMQALTVAFIAGLLSLRFDPDHFGPLQGAMLAVATFMLICLILSAVYFIGTMKVGPSLLDICNLT